jgi:hypothetical protein
MFPSGPYWSPVIPHANNERARALGDGAHVPDYGPYANADWPVVPPRQPVPKSRK